MNEAASASQRVSILLVDDRPANLVALRAILERNDYTFVLAESGEEALDCVLRHDFAAILIDVAMPRLDGIETAALIKQRARSSHVPIIFVTAHVSDVEAIARGYASGGVDYLQKPLDPDTVRAKVAVFAELYRDNKRIVQQSRVAQEEVEALAQASLIVAEAVASVPEASILAVLKTIALQAQALTTAQYVGVGVGTDPERPFDPWVFVGMSDKVAQTIGRPAPRPVGLLGVVARENVVVRIADLRRHPAHGGLPQFHPEMTTFLGIPIRFRGASVGNIYLANKSHGREFTDRDEQLIAKLASRAGVAIQTARLYQTEGLERVWLQSVLDQMPEGVVVMDAHGRVTAQNRLMSNLSSGETAEADPLGNRICFDMRRPSGGRVPPAELPYVRALRSNESSIGEELVLRRRDGGLVPVLVSAAPVQDRAGRVAGVAMTFHDISQIKETEHRRQEWTSVVAHDLRQPVGIIAVSAAALHKECSSDSSRRSIERIQRAARRIDEMVSDLLDVSCIEARQLAIRRSEVDLVALVRSVVERMPHAPKCRIRAVARDYSVSVDPARIEQVLVNLLSNAAKYGDPEAPVEIELAKRDNEVRVVVTNRGAGISANDLSRLFARFARVGESQGKVGGLGLGLYICKGLIEAHGGRIWAESTPGETTRFVFTLPL